LEQHRARRSKTHGANDLKARVQRWREILVLIPSDWFWFTARASYRDCYNISCQIASSTSKRCRGQTSAPKTPVTLKRRATHQLARKAAETQPGFTRIRASSLQHNAPASS